MSKSVKAPVRTFYRTVFEVEILSEEPLPDCNLMELLQECEDGPYSGESRQVLEEVVTAFRMATLLRKQGSDTEFFQLGPRGKDLSDA